MEVDNGSYGSAIGWFLLGSLAGACTALLFAPATSKKDDVVRNARPMGEKAGRTRDKVVRKAGGASLPPQRSSALRTPNPLRTGRPRAGRQGTPPARAKGASGSRQR